MLGWNLASSASKGTVLVFGPVVRRRLLPVFFAPPAVRGSSVRLAVMSRISLAPGEGRRFGFNHSVFVVSALSRRSYGLRVTLEGCSFPACGIRWVVGSWCRGPRRDPRPPGAKIVIVRPPLEPF